jgi:hypothetical protein
LEDGQLMAQREILEYQGVGVRTPRRRPVRMRVSMVAIIHRAGRTFNGDEADGVSRRDIHLPEARHRDSGAVEEMARASGPR